MLFFSCCNPPPRHFCVVAALWVLVPTLLSSHTQSWLVAAQRFDCQSSSEDGLTTDGSSSSSSSESKGGCVNRALFRIKAVVHGTQEDPFWLQVKAAMIQASVDMGVQFDITLYEAPFNSMHMVSDIDAIGLNKESEPLPDALIVSVPDATVQNAVGNLIRSYNVPVFGVNVGASVAEAMGILGYVAMGDTLAGNAAGERFLQLLNADQDGGNEATNGTLSTQQNNQAIDTGVTDSKRGLYVNSNYINVQLEERYIALETVLDGLVEFTKVNVDGSDQTSMIDDLTTELAGCPYHIIQLAEDRAVEALRQAMQANGCSYATTHIGAFGVNAGDSDVYRSIYRDELQFSIDQQPYLQGASTVIMATLFATTGKRLAQSGESEEGNYLPGPVLVDKQTIPSESQEICLEDAFPVCPNDLGSDGRTKATCPCTTRSKLIIAGVTHGDTSDLFWDEVYAASAQAGIDFDVDLKLIRLEPEDSDDVFYDKMSSTIQTLCTQTSPDTKISGLFVSLTNEVVLQAIQYCVNASVPVVSINSGEQLFKRYGTGILTHIGQTEFGAGKSAGLKMIESGAVTEGVCLKHELNNEGLEARCAGMKAAFEENTGSSGVTYLGDFLVSSTGDAESYRQIVEDAVVGASDRTSWAGVGALACGLSQLDNILAVKAVYPELVVATFDTAPELYGPLQSGDVLFGIDQNAYLQGYWPVPFLTWYASTNQKLVNDFIESGPRFVTQVAQDDEQQCQQIFFEACPNTTVPSSTTPGDPSTASSGVIPTTTILVSSTLLLSCFTNLLSWLAV